MKKILPFLLFSILSLGAVAHNTGEFKPKKHDFGTIDRQKNQFIEAVFEITNTDQTPIVIYKVDVSCNCIANTYTSKPIKKNGTGYVKLRINVNLLPDGSFNKTAFVKTNLPENNGVLLLRVVGTVK